MRRAEPRDEDFRFVRRVSAGPGIPSGRLSAVLDSGFAPFGRAPE